jgi:hypothetical protein
MRWGVHGEEKVIRRSAGTRGRFKYGSSGDENLKPCALIFQMKRLGSITEREPSIRPHGAILFSIVARRKMEW